jgi:hypothetical protein
MGMPHLKITPFCLPYVILYNKLYICTILCITCIPTSKYRHSTMNLNFPLGSNHHIRQCVPQHFSHQQSGRSLKLTTSVPLVPETEDEWSHISTPSIRLRNFSLFLT